MRRGERKWSAEAKGATDAMSSESEVARLEARLAAAELKLKTERERRERAEEAIGLLEANNATAAAAMAARVKELEDEVLALQAPQTAPMETDQENGNKRDFQISRIEAESVRDPSKPRVFGQVKIYFKEKQ